ncbi:TetR family transcriptional regulator [Mycobacterium saskatchewanense]|uniref:HTH tetR-type domain-containing protein n=1 Tax=Mycobacterium saskatchewanense TaxID=220927 RepID=A0AAJ3TTL4_9MYCO|nr:TetR/AcrR family transcriptional regulator [Mycobacterium saskatchewanense]ORW68531.1 hypothetical protein AWC23_20925 [Mycobacterium saskatchewanense]BBX64213.1 TetR family transcriptional regulator [Mycobacterium saskatchewanense]
MRQRGHAADAAIGRPRADGSRPASPREEIIRAATRLFAEKGFVNTTMTSVAEAAGLRQPSVYYYFRNKEELLYATASINRFSATVVTLLRDCDATPAEKLYRLLYEDTKHICNLAPLDYHQVENVAYQRPEEFSEFWTDYHALFDGIVEFIEQGVESGQFSVEDPRIAGAAALSLNEGLQKLHRYRQGSAADRGLPLPIADLDDEKVAHQSATTTLASLLVDRGALAQVRAAASAIALDVAPEG